MKIVCYENNGEYATLRFSAYLPRIEWNRLYKPEIGGHYYKTEIDFSTKICIINNSTLFQIVVKLLGFGFGIYVKEKHESKNKDFNR